MNEIQYSNLPDGIELSINVYLIGKNSTQMVINIKGFSKFSLDIFNENNIDIESLINLYNLNDFDSDWRVMSREEIRQYKQDKEDDEDEPRRSRWPISLFKF